MTDKKTDETDAPNHEDHHKEIYGLALSLIRCIITDDKDRAKSLVESVGCFPCMVLLTAVIAANMGAHFTGTMGFSPPDSKIVILALISAMERTMNDGSNRVQIDPRDLEGMESQG